MAVYLKDIKAGDTIKLRNGETHLVEDVLGVVTLYRTLSITSRESKDLSLANNKKQSYGLYGNCSWHNETPEDIVEFYPS